MLKQRKRAINKKIKELEEELNALNSQRVNIIHYNGGEEFSDTSDNELERQLYFTKLMLRELKVALENMDVELIDNDTIQIGSTFSLTLDGQSPMTMTLVEKLSPADKRSAFITPNSPLGAAVLGKREGEAFSYLVQDPRFKTTTEFNGTINQIIKKDKGTSKIKK